RPAAQRDRALDRRGVLRRARRHGRHVPPAGAGGGRHRLGGPGLRLDLVGPGAAAVTAVAPYTAITIGDAAPQVHAGAWVAPTVVLAGRVTIAERASVWYSSVLRGDMDAITVGPGSNVQDGSVLHADPGFPLSIGSGVSVGHRAVLHGCTIGDDVL